MLLRSSTTRFTYLAWSTTAYAVAVILWGAWVRISGSGAGCGEHWPLCKGEILPDEATVHTWVELSHRLSTGLFGLLVAGLVFMAFRTYPKGHPSRIWAVWAAVFTIIEALIGAKLVLFGLVADDESTLRVFSMALHLVNTLLLLGSLTVCAVAAPLSGPFAPAPLCTRRTVWIVFGLFALIAATGAVAALSVTLFPTQSLMEGLTRDLSSDAHITSRLRIFHPVLGGSIVWLIWILLGRMLVATNGGWISLARSLMVVQVAFGSLTLLFLSPVWMKIVHLLLADALWITISAASAHAIYRTSPLEEQSR